MLRHRRVRIAVATLSALGLVSAGLAASGGSAVASVGTDQSDISQLEQQIAAQGEHAQELVSRYNEVQARVNALDAQIAHDQSLLATDKHVEATATRAMLAVAVTAYVSGTSMDSPALAMFSGRWSVGKMLEQSQYLGAANNKLADQLTSLRIDEAHTHDTQRALQSEQTQATQTLAELTAARNAATSAIAEDQTQLSHVKGNLVFLLAQAAKRRRDADEAAERALATAPRAPTVDVPVPTLPPTTLPPTPSPSNPPPVSSPTPTPPSPSSSGAYANPFRDAVALSPERIDQGVDYAGLGTIYAIGDGVVLGTVGAGWPGGTFIAYQLSDGPASGLVVYAAEDINPSVQAGQTVTSSTVIGQMYAGPTGIETGWANGASLPDTMARDTGQFNGSNSTAFGYNFSRLLQSLGAPGGIAEGSPTGLLPAGWPSW